jgi:biotin synthase
VPYQTLLRTIATARIVLPTTIIRLAAGRQTLSENEQAMCFMAGANAVFTGEQMLTTPCSPWDEVRPVLSHRPFAVFSPADRARASQDKAMMARWGLEGMRSFTSERVSMKETREVPAESERAPEPLREAI